MRLPTSLMTGVLLVCAAGARAQTTKGGKIDPAWLRADAASKTADFKLVAGLTDANGGMNFNGFSQGGLVLTVPQGWNVVLHFKNEDPNLPHSVEIIAEAPAESRSRAFGAYYLIRDCVVTSGSFLGAWLWSISPRTNFIGAAICGGLGTVWFWWFVFRRLQKH